MKTLRTALALVAAAWLCAPAVHTQEPRKPTLYLVATAHLDTQWNWTVQDSIRRFIPATFDDNFKLFEQYPDYVFNFEGIIHYMWFKEYHPADWPALQKYVAAGRWRLSGSWINAADTNVPSPESLMRQALYAKRFQRQEFGGKTSQDIYLPDCFGFGFALPSIGAHSGLKAFSTQKLTWGASKPTPFAIGMWKGVDGSALVAELRPGDYVTAIKSATAGRSASATSASATPAGRPTRRRSSGSRKRWRTRRARSRCGTPAPTSCRATSRTPSGPRFRSTRVNCCSRRTASAATPRRPR
jgi:alpha-mannosidase